ncbi:hypothetical protein GGR58DRAFT_528508 [Xylaria digitata]|nr:hypothetical protein GGR58DRAFT_528508 [Xylaria digitata]
MSLHRESRYYALRRFWIAPHSKCRPCWGLRSSFYIVDLEADTFDMDVYLERHNSRVTRAMGPLFSRIRNVSLKLSQLHLLLGYLSLGNYELPALRRIYVKACIQRKWGRSCHIPTLPSTQAGHELEVSRVVLDKIGGEVYAEFWPTTVQEGSCMRYGGDLYVGKYIHQDDGFKEMDRTFPYGWETISTTNWSVLRQLGLVCIFLYEDISGNSRNYLPNRSSSHLIARRRVYVFSTTRGPIPEILENSSKSSQY